ncbi:MAG: DUF1385 domain-containing protein [Clostridia bacterium]|nr:DUF1385 domain-containing protein [Clostridia bacterium]
MSKKEMNCRLGTVGGEAVLEGVMMKGKDGTMGVAVRREDGTVVVTKEKHTSVRKKHKILNLPIIRGVVGMVESFLLSFKVLNISAEVYGEGIDEEPSKFEKWLEKKFGKSLMDFVMVIASVLGVALALGLFMYLPMIIAKWIENLAGADIGNWKTVVEGFLKIGIFIAYLSLVSLMKDIRRTFEYHGAEHKSIFCYEAGEELTPENVKKYSRFHPRCGTSFMFVMLIISILIFMFVPWPDKLWIRFFIKLPLMPVAVGLGFEFIMLAGKYDNWFIRMLSAPGLFMQRITTREPDEKQLEVAIIALKTALPEDFPDFVPPTEENLKKAAEEEAKAEESEATEENND